MNDFTKEELGIIFCNLCVTDKTEDVLKKVGEMFENYCDHEWENHCCGCTNSIVCSKCDKYLTDGEGEDSL